MVMTPEALSSMLYQPISNIYLQEDKRTCSRCPMEARVLKDIGLVDRVKVCSDDDGLLTESRNSGNDAVLFPWVFEGRYLGVPSPARGNNIFNHCKKPFGGSLPYLAVKESVVEACERLDVELDVVLPQTSQ